MSTARLTAIRIHPVKDEPGQALQRVGVGPEGLDGDRRKKAPVHLVGEDEGQTRANLILDVPSAALADWVGGVVTIGDVRLGIARTAGNCAGVYADVLTPGELAVGDTATVILAQAD